MTPHEDRDPHDDRDRAAAEHRARDRLMGAGATTLPRQPWLRRGQPPSATDLVRYALWQADGGRIDDGDVEAALALLASARAEVEQCEAALLFTARGRGMPWSRIARAMGLGSAQAAQQRLDRITSRAASRAEA